MLYKRLGFIFLLAPLLPVPLRGATEVHIKLAGQGGEAGRLSVALPPFIAENPLRTQDALSAHQLREIVRSDLMYSRYFKLLEEGPALSAANPQEAAKDWKTRGAGWLLTGKASQAGGKLSLSVQLMDLNSGETAFERHYRQEPAFLRSLAHRVADDAVLAMTGRAGIAHTQIAFSNNQTGHKEIYSMDYDGAGLRQLTRDRALSILPRFSRDRRLLAYTGYQDGNPDLFLIDLEQGKTRVLSNEQGLNIAGGFSPDGSQILLTLSRGKSPNLYLKSLSDASLTRLTQHFGADSSPTFSPDGSQAAFVSDRSGNPQIYLLDMDTQRAKRLTNLNWCDSPSWSPTGEWIAFAGRANQKDRMDIFLVDVTGNQIRQLTRGEGSNENPSWSSDGRFIAFASTRSGRSEVYVMDADGSAPHKPAEIPGSSFTPTWSN